MIRDMVFLSLWSAGCYPGREVRNPLTADIVRGKSDIERVFADLLALTKLNFNNAGFSKELPVTLRLRTL